MTTPDTTGECYLSRFSSDGCRQKERKKNKTSTRTTEAGAMKANKKNLCYARALYGSAARRGSVRAFRFIFWLFKPRISLEYNQQQRGETQQQRDTTLSMLKSRLFLLLAFHMFARDIQDHQQDGNELPPCLRCAGMGSSENEWRWH